MSNPFRLNALTEPRIVVVPDVTAKELTALADKDLEFKYLERDFRKWDYYTDLNLNKVPGRGVTFEAHVYRPEQTGRRPGTLDIRVHFVSLKLEGYVAPFIQWCRICGLAGKFATIPVEPECLFAEDFRAPLADLSRESRSLSTFPYAQTWPLDCSFVAFRRVG